MVNTALKILLFRNFIVHRNRGRDTAAVIIFIIPNNKVIAIGITVVGRSRRRRFY